MGSESPEKVVGKRDDGNMIVFFEGCCYVFDLEDLLRSSAEVLGKGTFGTAYKTILEDGFGNRGEDRIPLDWDTRLKIAIGMARGVARIHAENSRKLAHGNIKSSNIFLNAELYSCISDLCEHPCPICSAHWIPSSGGRGHPEGIPGCDIYSIGVVLLELLTGRSPVQATAGDELVHLVRWVQSVVKEEWTGEVFDLELKRYPNIEVELVEMLQIALACVLRIPDQRPKIAELVKMIEDVRSVGTGNRSLNEVKTEENDGRTAEAGTSG